MHPTKGWVVDSVDMMKTSVFQTNRSRLIIFETGKTSIPLHVNVSFFLVAGGEVKVKEDVNTSIFLAGPPPG